MSSHSPTSVSSSARILSEAVEDYMEASGASGQSGKSISMDSEEVDDDMAAYDAFLASKGRAASVDATTTNPVVESLTHVPSYSQFSALSSDSAPSLNKSAPLTTSAPSHHPPKPRVNDMGVGNGDDEYDDELLAFHDDGNNGGDDYGDDFDDDNSSTPAEVLVRIGSMTLTKNQAKLYGLDRVGKTNFVKSSVAAVGSKPRAIDSKRINAISKPVRTYTARDSRQHAKESERLNCTFIVKKSAAAITAMKSAGCGYDFLTDDNTTYSDFVTRMDTFEHHRRKMLEKKQEEQVYNATLGKKTCPNCGNPQSYDEFIDKRMQCCSDRCDRKFDYCVPNAFYMDKWEKRMSKIESFHQKMTNKLLKERQVEYEVGRVKRTKQQQDLIDRVGASGHEDVINGMAFNSLGSWVATASKDKSVRIWDLKNATELMKFEGGHSASINDVKFNKSGTSLATCSDDNKVVIWNTETGEPSVTLSGHTAPVNSVAFTKDGRTAASGSNDSTVRVWDVQKQAERGVLQGHTGAVHEISISPNGALLASVSSDNTLRIWDMKELKIVKVVELRSGGGASSSSRYPVDFSPDSSTVVTGSRNELTVWDVADGAEVMTLNGGDKCEVNSVAFSPDGKMIGFGGKDSSVRVFDLRTKSLKYLLEGHSQSVNCVKFSPDSKQLISGGDDRGIKIWDLESGREGKKVNGVNFIGRMYQDVQKKKAKLKELESQTALLTRGECTFQPQLNIVPSMLKNRDPEMLYRPKEIKKSQAQLDAEEEEARRKKLERTAAAAAAAAKQKEKRDAKKEAKKEEERQSAKEKENSKANATETRMAEKSAAVDDTQMRSRFEELLL
jgi:WD40 repeat protein